MIRHLAVRDSQQKQGVGRELLRLTLASGGCSVVRLSTPQATGYYPHPGHVSNS